MRTLLFLSALTFAACGGSSSPDTIPPAPASEPAAPAKNAEHAGHGEHGGHAHGEHGGHGASGGPVDKFHDKLAPLWHAPEGVQRVTDTCAAVADLHGVAHEIIAAGAPAGAAPDFLDAAKALEQSVGVLHGECETAAKKDFAAKFAAVHDAFHAVEAKSRGAH